MNSVASKAFNIAELLEAVLLELPCKDVLILQRVSRFWKATIDASLKLQKALCFTSSQQGQPTSRTSRRLAMFLESTSAREFHAQVLGKQWPVYDPVFKHICPPWAMSKCQYIAEYTDTARNLVSHVKNSSLEKAFITQPKPTEVRVFCNEIHAAKAGR